MKLTSARKAGAIIFLSSLVSIAFFLAGFGVTAAVVFIAGGLAPLDRHLKRCAVCESWWATVHYRDSHDERYPPGKEYLCDACHIGRNLPPWHNFAPLSKF